LATHKLIGASGANTRLIALIFFALVSQMYDLKHTQFQCFFCNALGFFIPQPKNNILIH
jgi:hypothetical protein